MEPATFQFVAQHLNHCATVVPLTASRNVKLPHCLFHFQASDVSVAEFTKSQFYMGVGVHLYTLRLAHSLGAIVHYGFNWFVINKCQMRHLNNRINGKDRNSGTSPEHCYDVSLQRVRQFLLPTPPPTRHQMILRRAAWLNKTSISHSYLSNCLHIAFLCILRDSTPGRNKYRALGCPRD